MPFLSGSLHDACKCHGSSLGRGFVCDKRQNENGGNWAKTERTPMRWQPHMSTWRQLVSCDAFCDKLRGTGSLDNTQAIGVGVACR